MAKLTVSVCATISRRAAAMSIDRSRSDSASRTCNLESAGSSETPGLGICSEGEVGESDESGRMQLLRNAGTDLVL